MRIRMNKDERRKSILDAAVMLAETTGYNAFSRDAVAEMSGCSNALVTNVFGSIQELREEIVRHAIAVENLVIIGQAIALRHPLALKLPDELKIKAKKNLFPAAQ